MNVPNVVSKDLEVLLRRVKHADGYIHWATHFALRSPCWIPGQVRRVFLSAGCAYIGLHLWWCRYVW